MCESTAYIKEGTAEELFLKDVVRITPLPGDKLLVENLLGDQREFQGRIQEIDFLSHKIVLTKG
jgi:predicted RNA-binding protein